ncbi:MAG: alpha/beta fold hydrolase [Actinobacteria bacterium]|nr:alpha/beta fold hydrolase [Actinomycetota bacterium]
MRENRTHVEGEGGVRLSVRLFDGPDPGAPGLLLHHGLASSSHIWDLMLPRLARRFRVVAYDARGHRRSSKPSSGYGFDHVVADALAVIRATRLGRPIFVGHSWGAMAGLDLVARHPRSTAGAVLIDGGLVTMRRHMDWRTAKERLAPPRIAGTPVEEFVATLRGSSAGGPPLTPELERTILTVIDSDRHGRIRPNLSYGNHLRILRAIWEQDPIALYPKVRVPVLAIASRPVDPGSDEREFLEAKRRALGEARRAARGRPVTFAWMAGIHDLPLQHPGPLARRISRFADGVVG